MKSFLAKNLWLVSAVLYSLSWVTYSGPNLSFLAWIAFVPLFVYLNQQTNHFRKFYGASVFVIAFWAFSTSFWLFNFPSSKGLVALTFLVEILHISFPFLLLFLAQKIIGFRRALFLFPFAWAAWEWVYIPFEHTIGTLPMAYSQGNNLWLVQLADLGGLWAVSFWVILFNVATYLVLNKYYHQFDSKSFAYSFGKLIAVMVAIPLMYATYSFQKWQEASEGSLQVSIVPTQFEPEYMMDQAYQKDIIENTLHRTDSVAYNLVTSNKGSDLYVWPEAGTSHWMEFDNISSVLHQATTDWSASLLTGCKGIPMKGDDQNAYVSGVLISPFHDTPEEALQYHHKTTLVPVTETLPYGQFMPKWFKTGWSQNYFTAGSSFKPLDIKDRNGNTYFAGVSLCYEQWFPSVWNRQVQNGADFFVHMAAEGWYGNTGYAQYMANVSRFRAIETRRDVVRCSNKGLSGFISASGKFKQFVHYGGLDMPTNNINTFKSKTFFSQHPNLFPLFCTFLSLGLFVFSWLQYFAARLIGPSAHNLTNHLNTLRNPG